MVPIIPDKRGEAECRSGNQQENRALCALFMLGPVSRSPGSVAGVTSHGMMLWTAPYLRRLGASK